MPAFPSWYAFLVSVLPLLPTAACYDMVREYSGQSFFDRWDFYGSWDNLTLGACVLLTLTYRSSCAPDGLSGDVWWLDRTSALEQGLAYTDAQGRAVLKVDNNSNVPWNQKRNSVRHRHLE